MTNADVVDWEPAPIETLSVWEKIRFKKFHKFYHEVARAGTAYQTKRDFVEYLLKRRFHTAQCVKVEIFMIFRPGRPFHQQSPAEVNTYKQLVYTFYPINQTGTEQQAA